MSSLNNFFIRRILYFSKTCWLFSDRAWNMLIFGRRCSTLLRFNNRLLIFFCPHPTLLAYCKLKNHHFLPIIPCLIPNSFQLITGCPRILYTMFENKKMYKIRYLQCNAGHVSYVNILLVSSKYLFFFLVWYNIPEIKKKAVCLFVWLFFFFFFLIFNFLKFFFEIFYSHDFQ